MLDYAPLYVYCGKERRKMTTVICAEIIAAKILLMREKRIMLDRDLARLYEVDTRQLTRQVRRNIDRFPEDFMFQLTKEDVKNLMCQFGTSSWGGERNMINNSQ